LEKEVSKDMGLELEVINLSLFLNICLIIDTLSGKTPEETYYRYTLKGNDKRKTNF
jgi:hypothetical protein